MATRRSGRHAGQPVPRPSNAVPAISSGGKDVSARLCPPTGPACRRSSSIKAVPQNGYGLLNGQTVFSHGVEFGVAKPRRAICGKPRMRGCSRTPEQSRASSVRDAADDADVAAVGHRDAAGQSVAARRAGTVERLHDVPGDGSLFYYLTVGSGTGRRGVSGRLPAHRRVDSAHRSALTIRRLILIQGASPLGLPDTRPRAPLCRRAPVAWIARHARSGLGNENSF